MSCNNTLTAGDLGNPTPITLILGAVKRIALNVYQKDPNDDFSDDCGNCISTGNILIPPTITIVSADVSIYKSPDTTTPVLTDTITPVDIEDDSSVVVGYKLVYLIDTSQAPLNEVGEYMLVLTYETSNGEIIPNIIYFNVFASAFVGNC